MPSQSWLGLFFDLAFVASIVVVSNSYSADYSAEQTLWLVGVFALIWTTWLMTTLRMAASPVTRTWPGVLIVAQMALVLLMAITANDFVEDTTESVGALFGLILVSAILLNRTLTEDDDPTRLGRSELVRMIAAIVLFAATWWTPDSGIIYVMLWLLGVALALSTIHAQKQSDPQLRHAIGHRFGEFTIIVLGESFLKIALVASEEPLEEVDLFALPLVFCVIAALWWLYFAHIAPLGVPQRHPRTWIMVHLPLHMFIVGLAVGLSKLLLPDADAYFGSGFALITVPLVLALLCIGVLIRLGGGPYARRGLRALLLGVLGVLAVVALNYLGRGLEFDLAGTVLLIAIVLAAVIRSIGPYSPRDDGTRPSRESDRADRSDTAPVG